MTLIIMDNSLTSSRNKQLLNEESDIGADKFDNLYSIDVNALAQPQLEEKSLKSNKIKTVKLSLFSVMAKNLIKQLTRPVMLFYIIAAMIQVVDEYTNSNNRPALLFPVIFIAYLNFIFNVTEEITLRNTDDFENKSKVQLLSPKPEEFADSKKVFVNWESIKPGNVVKVKRNQFFPADLLLVSSSNKSGDAYVDIQNITGETTLVRKESVGCFHKIFQHNKNEAVVVDKLGGKIACDLPNENLNNFSGVYIFNSTLSDGEIPKNLF